MARSDLQGQTGGGGIVDFDITVTDAWFGFSEALNQAAGEDILLLHWTGTTNLEERPVLDEAGFHPSWKLSNKWEAVDGGKSVRFVGGGKQAFGKSYGRLCEQAFALTEAVADTDADPFKDAHPKDASAWIGTKWHMDEVEFEFGGSIGTVRELQPVAYLGKGDVAAPVSTAAPAAAAAAPAASNGDLRATVENLARSMDNYADFQKAALAIPGVAADGGLLMDIANQAALYDKVRG